MSAAAGRCGAVRGARVTARDARDSWIARVLLGLALAAWAVLVPGEAERLMTVPIRWPGL